MPDAIFIGGGVTNGRVIETCWNALKPGGRLVANAVTLQSEMLLFNWREKFGGELTRLGVRKPVHLALSMSGDRHCPSQFIAGSNRNDDLNSHVIFG